MSRHSVRLALGTALALMVPAAGLAADESVCTAPGITALSDANGDVMPGLITQLAEPPVGLPLSFADLLAVNVTVIPGDPLKLMFTIETGGLETFPSLPPNSVWYATFESANKSLRGVRMTTDASGEPIFQSYAVAPGGLEGDGPSDGRFPVEGSEKAAESDSGYGGGTITIVVKASDVGVRNAGDVLSRFNAAYILSIRVPGVLGFADTYDEAPTGLDRGASASVTIEDCGEGKSGLQQAFGGAFGGLALLLMGLGAALRRRV